MKNKKGFTLVQLLAVIAILAIILFFAVPKILRDSVINEQLDILEEAKHNSFRSSVNGVFAAAKLLIAKNDGVDFSSEQDIELTLTLTSEALTGTWKTVTDENGEVTIVLSNVSNNKYCAKLVTEETRLTSYDITTGSCES